MKTNKNIYAHIQGLILQIFPSTIAVGVYKLQYRALASKHQELRELGRGYRALLFFSSEAEHPLTPSPFIFLYQTKVRVVPLSKAEMGAHGHLKNKYCRQELGCDTYSCWCYCYPKLVWVLSHNCYFGVWSFCPLAT